MAKLSYVADTAEVWEGGPPADIKALVKGRPIYDPRLDSTVIIDATTSPVTMGSGSHRYATSSTWAWSDNPALCVADYLVNIMGVSASESIDWPSIAAAADDCEVQVVIPPAASPENTQSRFTCNGSLSLGATHKDNLDSLISSCDGKLTYSSGKWRLRASVWESSSVSITQDDLSGQVEIRGSAPKSERFNKIRGFFVDPSRKYQPAEFPHVTDTAYLTRDNGEVISYDMELPFTNDQYMAQRIAIRNLKQGNNQIACTLNMNVRGAKVQVGDVVDITIDYLGWSAKTFRCIEWARSQDGTFKIAFREDNAASYTDPLVTDYGVVGSSTVTIQSGAVPAPTGLTATAAASGVQLAWTSPPAAEYDFIDIYESTGSVFDTSPILTRIARVRADNYLVPHDEDSTTYYYWIKAVRLPSLQSERYPDNSSSPETSVSATMGAAAAGARVRAYGASLNDVAFDPADAEVGFRVDSDGDIYTREGTGGSWTSIGTWLLSGTNADYDCRLDVDSGDTPTSGASTGTWLATTTDRDFILTETVVAGAGLNNSMTLRFRDDTTLEILSSAEVTMSVDVEP